VEFLVLPFLNVSPVPYKMLETFSQDGRIPWAYAFEKHPLLLQSMFTDISARMTARI